MVIIGWGVGISFVTLSSSLRTSLLTVQITAHSFLTFLAMTREWCVGGWSF
ncbi:hypothetical protein COMA1_11522 [Candidatus Nitrospira nitrosa]|uniref:Uncharacterized protein n=1 Tax=Candidatus Nitrospira nitrosa TaxID=1742972 RepID=A0A0S4L8V0_9BACT|nr:hypothetical protein COMA1_11522 [Candidatus Nitrospira nitrosa]